MAEQRSREEDFVRDDAGAPSKAPIVLVVFGAALLAGIAGAMATGFLAMAAVLAVACGGAFFASRLAPSGGKPMVDTARPRRLLLLFDRSTPADPKAPPEFTGEWATLYERVNKLVQDSRVSAAQSKELEQVRRHAETAAALLHEGKDPLVEAPELRAGLLQSLLESVRSTASQPVVSQLTLGEEELIGQDGDTLPPDWPKPSTQAASAEIQNGLKELIREIEGLRGTLAGAPAGESAPSREDASLRTPAQLVDAVVLTAADGIEDLAAGLMRANELASVAERVTNRATLLALNAALEATRSGSEAFAAIAEETRRLAEFAREATDTISRLSSEIEYKVGETITAIHATSEDAKNSLAELSGSTPNAVPTSARNARVQVVRLLDRSRALLNSIGESGTQSGAVDSQSGSEILNSTTDTVENAPPSADNLPVEGMLLIEGLKPGSQLER